MQVITHIFLLCFVLGFGALYANTHGNYIDFKKHEKEFLKPEISETLHRKKEAEERKKENKGEPQENTQPVTHRAK